MTPRQRLLAALKGQPVDRLPWAPNLAYWWQFERPELQARGEVAVLKAFGCDPLMRGHYSDPRTGAWIDLRMYDTVYDGCSVEERTWGDRKIRRIQSAKGSLEAEYVLSPSGDTWFLKTHPIRAIRDYEILIDLFEHTRLEPNFERYVQLEAQYGEEALFVPQLGLPLNAKSGFQALLEFWVGTQQLVYDVCDEPDIIEAALNAMRKVGLEAARICAASPAQVVLTWEDTSTTNLSPALYAKYILPEINAWCDILHAGGKRYMQHACGHLLNLMPIMGASQIDGIESISPPPTGNIELWDARSAMRPGQFLVGGIEPTVFLNSSTGALAAYVCGLIQRMAGTPFVLANSDSCPPGVAHEKFTMISEMVRG